MNPIALSGLCEPVINAFKALVLACFFGSFSFHIGTSPIYKSSFFQFYTSNNIYIIEKLLLLKWSKKRRKSKEIIY